MAGLRGMMGRKVGMTRVFAPDGQSIGVTVLEVGPCTVLQKKTVEREGYNALQLGFKPKRLNRLNLPEQGHVKRAGLDHGFYYIREVKVDNPDDYELGQELTLKDLDIKQLIDITGISKGRGFTGTIKRWGFHRGKMAHGSKHHRTMGSTGQSAFPSKVIKGKRMPGRMGGETVTIRNLMVIDVRPEENLLLVKGAVPGAVNQMICIRCK